MPIITIYGLSIRQAIIVVILFAILYAIISAIVLVVASVYLAYSFMVWLMDKLDG